MNKLILNTKVQDFINKNLKSESIKLILKGSPFKTIDIKAVIEQIEAKKRCKSKLPLWFKTKIIYFPNKLNIEQTSSEITAQYKSELMSGENIIDLTGGFGVDCFYFSKQFKTVFHCEINKTLSNIANHNYKALNIQNIKTINTDGITYLKRSKSQYDWIYIDPSRRHDSKGKVFFLKDCLPNVPEHVELLFKHSKHIMIKTSPLLDLSVGIGELKHVKTVHIVAVNNEVKELLWVLDYNFKGEIEIKTVNLNKKNKVSFNFTLAQEKQLESPYSEPLSYLYEPNAAILKAGGFHSITEELKVFKLQKHSHLYTNDSLIDFPGRAFKIENVLPYNKKELKKLVISKANIRSASLSSTFLNNSNTSNLAFSFETF